MPVQTIVRNPKQIETEEELVEMLSRIQTYEQERKCKAGVIHIQRRLFGSLFMIVSKEEARGLLKTKVGPTTPEWGIEYYPSGYFEKLRKHFSEKKPEPQYSQ